MRWDHILVGLCLFVVLAYASPPLHAEPHMSDLRVALEEGRVLLSFELSEAMSEEVVERIQTGLPTGFTYQFRLDRDRKRWFDASLATSDLQISAMFNAVTDEYLVNTKLDGKLIDSQIVRDLDSLRLAMTRLERVAVFELTDTTIQDRLLVRARAELGTKSGFLFLPTRVTTDWLRSRKFRPADEAG